MAGVRLTRRRTGPYIGGGGKTWCRCRRSAGPMWSHEAGNAWGKAFAMVAEGALIGGRYRILAQIGAGGMATVYLAMDVALNRRWAVKQMRDVGSPARHDAMMRGLRAESALIARLDHPAIPRIVDLITDASEVFVVMDFVEGETLRALLEREGPRSEAQAVDWGIQLCDVLDYLHRRTPMVVYRDLKPSNIMLTPDGSIRLIDFGIALETGDAGAARPAFGDGLRMGTPGYGAPEQFDRDGTVEARADIHALGATLFHLLTGRHPRDGIVPIRRIRPDLSEGLERVIAKATSADPDRRYRTCAEFAYALGHSLDDEPARRNMLRRRWRAFVGTVSASAACLALSGGTLLASDRVRDGDYAHWMTQAERAPDRYAAERACARAAGILPGAIEPYLHLIERYEADGVYSADEERTYLALMDRHADALRSDETAWAALCFDTGRLYWYYYASSSSDAEDDGDRRLTRIRAAAPWMRDAAGVETFGRSELAGMYAGIAEFNVRIVPLIDSGDDAGRYGPYFVMLRSLVDTAAEQDNEVMRLEAANLALDAMRAYPRKFRADGVPMEDMAGLCDAAGRLAETTGATDEAHDAARNRALGNVAAARQAVEGAFTDS